MPLDQLGRVIVNPNVPLGLDEFAAMYTANGKSPNENASNLWFNAPTQGRSYIEDQWSKLNMGTSPEAYFSDPSHVAAASHTPPQSGSSADPLGRIPVSPGNTGQAQWPMYRNDAARQTAMSLGMDQRGSYTTPDRMMAAISGDLSRVPQSDLLDHPELTELLKVDPAKAHFVYSQLSGGRDFSKDRGEVDSLRRQDLLAKQTQARKDFREPFEYNKELVKEMIKQNAHYDPVTGKLMLWQQTEPDPNAIDQRPIMQRVEASPEKNRAWHSAAYQAVTGLPSPQFTADPNLAAAQSGIANLPTDISKKVQSEVDRWRGLGKTITPAVIAQITGKIQDENKSVFAMPGAEGGSRYEDMATSFAGNMSGATGWQAGRSIQDYPRNQWGRLMDSIKNGVGGFYDRFTPSGHGYTDMQNQAWNQPSAEEQAAQLAARRLPWNAVK